MTQRKLDVDSRDRDDKTYDTARAEMSRLDALDLAPQVRMSHGAALRLVDRMLRDACREDAVTSWCGAKT